MESVQSGRQPDSGRLGILMKLNEQKIMRDVLGDPFSGPCIGRTNGAWVLFWPDGLAPSDGNISPREILHHEDWKKFLWLCQEWRKKQPT